MEPLQPVEMPTHGVLIGINTTNSWQSGTSTRPVRLAYIATNSTQRLSFVSVQSTAHPEKILRVGSRPSNFDDMPYGLVVELYLTEDIADSEAVYLSLAQSGATTYYPPQQIDDAR
jgi:hypothetical protein